MMETSNFLTNLSSLQGQLSLSRTESMLNRSIRNLSTGLRINVPKDAPIDYVSAATFESRIGAMSQAVSGTQRASSLISTADAALGQLHSILNDIRAIITQAANTGVEVTATLNVLQLQLNDSLDAIDRIAQSTTFLDKTILDGSLSFQTYGVDRSKVTSLSIDQANFLGRVEKDVDVKVIKPARRAELVYPYGALGNDVTIQLGGNQGYQVFDFAKDATVEMMAQTINTFSNSTGVLAEVRADSAQGQIAITSPGSDNDIIVTASKPGTREGNITVQYTAAPAGNPQLGLIVTQASDDQPLVVEVQLETTGGVNGGEVMTTAAEIVQLLNTSPLLRDADGNGILTATLPAMTLGTGRVSPFAEYCYYGSVSDKNQIQFLAPSGTPNIRFVSVPGEKLSIDDTSIPPVYGHASLGTLQGELIEAGILVIHLETDHNGIVQTTANDLVKWLASPPNAEAARLVEKYGISAAVISPLHPTESVCTAGTSSQGTGKLKPTYDPASCPTTEVIRTQYPDLVFQTGYESKPTTPLAARGAPLLGASDSAGLGLIFRSVDTGSDAFVSIIALRNTEFTVINRSGVAVERTTGSDVIAEINGQIATGHGHIAMTQTSDLSMSLGINPNLPAGTVFGFRISGGGALLQLGPDAKSSHQARIALPDIHTAVLGGEMGKLADLRSGGIADVFTNTRLGFQIIEDVIGQVAYQRGQLGAFQSYHLDVNLAHLTDAIGITEESLSRVRDTDFAAESSLMARNQVLMQANIAVLRYPSENARLLLGLLQR